MLHPSERFIFRITVAAGVIDLALVAVRGASLDLRAYGLILALCAGLAGAGLAYRRSGRSEPIGATLVSAALFILFTAALSLFNYSLTPNPRHLIDPWLSQADAMLGYSWPGAIAWAARHPALNEFMRVAYLSTLPQIAMLVAALGLTARLQDLYSLMLTVVIGGTITVLFWGLFPTAGPSAFASVSPALLDQVRPVLGQAYGPYVVALLQNGSPYLSPDDFSGLVSFPSFHTVLALAATWHARRVWWLFPACLVLNVAVLPAVLVHGAHHLVDIPAGAAVFLVALAAARAILRSRSAIAVLRVREAA